MSNNKYRSHGGNKRCNYIKIHCSGNRGDTGSGRNPVLMQFEEFSAELDAKHDKYERIVKLSRDITIESKRIIFLLHKVDKRNEDFLQILSNARERFDNLFKQHFFAIAKELHGLDPYQYARAYSAGLQEFIEAYAYYEHMSDVKISNWQSLQGHLTYSDCMNDVNEVAAKKNETIKDVKDITIQNEQLNDVRNDKMAIMCFIQPIEYMLGLGDLSGEIMRRCINSLGIGDINTCFSTCNFLQQMYSGFIGISQQHNKELHRKIYTLRQSLLKTENVCYNIKVRGNEAAKWGAADELLDKSLFNNDEDEGFF